jgi:uncharacterized protein YeaO (DUF488 family)
VVKIKRIYDPPSEDDGVRILVDRLWPRGISKEAAAIDEWERDIAPSDELRKWFSHDPARWQEFRRRYVSELRKNPELISKLRRLAKKGPLTLLFAAKDVAHNNAVVLRELIGK